MLKKCASIISCISLVSVALMMFPGEVSAQKFWLTTYSFPGGPKTSITLGGDSCFLVGLTNKVIKSCDDCNNWDYTLSTLAIFCLSNANSGRILAGGAGKIFFTDNYGETWDSVALNTLYPVTKIIRVSNGDLFAITGSLDQNGDYTGAGVFYSADNGTQWVARNNGLGSNTCCEQIAADINGRLYVAVPDKYVTGSKGLFISDDSGLSWQHVNISVDGQGAISDQVKVGNTTGLSVSPGDTVYLSISGTSVNTGVTLNIQKSIYDISENSYWKVNKVADVNYWWNDRLLNNIHFALNGDWYSSISGTLLTGGTFFSVNQGKSWTQHREGLGLSESGMFNVQFFTETDSGKIYMVQLMDERIYWADTSMTLSVPGDYIDAETDFQIYPNPVKRNGRLTLQLPPSQNRVHLIINDITGKIIFERSVERAQSITAPAIPGIYLVNAKWDGGYPGTFKLIVNQ